MSSYPTSRKSPPDGVGVLQQIQKLSTLSGRNLQVAEHALFSRFTMLIRENQDFRQMVITQAETIAKLENALDQYDIVVGGVTHE